MPIAIPDQAFTSHRSVVKHQILNRVNENMVRASGKFAIKEACESALLDIKNLVEVQPGAVLYIQGSYLPFRHA